MTIPDSKMVENGSIEVPYAPEEERRIVQELTAKAESNLAEGDLFYVISSRWFSAWQKYTGLSVGANPIEKPMIAPDTCERPGPIDNGDIIVGGSDNKCDDPQLLRTLLEGRDYELVPKEVWEILFQWYNGGPALPRKVICLGDNQQLTIEVYPLCLNIIDSNEKNEKVLRLSKKDSLHTLYERVCGLKGILLERARIWDYFNRKKCKLLSDSNLTLEEAELQMDHDILLEVQAEGFQPPSYDMDSTGNNMALVPVEPLRSSVTIAGGPVLSNGFSNRYTSDIYQQSSSRFALGGVEDGYDDLRNTSKGESRGLAGLQNLGNTCFMNSALQCLAHTPPLVEYFLQDYSEEINKHNPLGMHGELALAFGELLRKLWSSGRSSIAPRAFKGKLGRFAPQFSGYNQHDSQELLAFLLDGLHEDLNRVKQKPYFETKDSDGRPDEEVADEFWRYHKARNDSVIVDVCQGQYKSTLCCPDCKKISITFDPFMYLSLPLPSTVTRIITVTVFYGDGGGLPMPYTVTVPKHGCHKDLLQALGTECCLQSDEYLLLAEVYQHRIFRYLENSSDPLHSIKDDDQIVAYRLPKRAARLAKLEVCHRFIDKGIMGRSKAGEWKLFLTPLITFMEEPVTGVTIDLAVDRILSPLRRKSYFKSLDPEGRENGAASEVVEEPMNCSMESGSMFQSADDMETEESSSTELSFRLCITDDRGMCSSPISNDTQIKSGPVVKVFLDWTEKDHESFDSSYLKDLPVVHKTGVAAKKTKQEAFSLFSCLEAFLKEEPLGPDDMWYCPSCKEHRQATKKLDLWRLPDILVFHLKRFSYNRWMKNKLDTFVNFPVHNLDLSKYMKSKNASEGSHVYELFAISNHYGGLGGGHYSAHCKLVDENRWYHFDDSHVSAAAESDIQTSAAYVLFYQRVKVQQNGCSEPSNSHTG
ncbi:hypothetical protein DM860_007143 [Cuscuta australis]|uniref:Ubiquitin carboxyl-terminal hydrolase n=1 Tax=Cuscuta australis TaxID=267555 RepID=A0A328EAD1_9ASTE|nr:hypothetical protein DM860_007143 [Cuscuta australis]